MTISGGRRSLARATLLTLVAGMLAVLVSAPPAVSATAVPCTRTWSGEGTAIAPEDPDKAPAYKWTVASIEVPASSDVEDIDVTYDITHRNASNLTVRLTRMVGATVAGSIVLQPRLSDDTSSQVQPLTFDDEAAAAYTATSPSGSYQPAAPLSTFDAMAAGATWRLDMANFGTLTTAELNSWSVSITYSVCDADADGAEDHTDNCRGLANPDQADLDGDGTGSACDPDLDGDGAANTADNCLTVVNPDQVDSDGDGTGNDCNGDDDGDSRPDAADGCPLTSGLTTSGCPSVGRTVSLKLVKKRTRLIGSVGAGLAGCRADTEVTLWQKRRGADRRLVLVATDDRGRFRTRAPRTGGKYYVTVPRTYLTGLAECAPDTSPKVRVRRR